MRDITSTTIVIIIIIIYKCLLIARSYVGKDSSKFAGGSAVYGGGGPLFSIEDCSTGLMIAVGVGTWIHWGILVARSEIFNQMN